MVKRSDFTQPRENLRVDGHRSVKEINQLYEAGRTFPRGKNPSQVFERLPVPDAGQGDGLVDKAQHRREVFLQQPQDIEDHRLPGYCPDVPLSDWRRGAGEDATTYPGY